MMWHPPILNSILVFWMTPTPPRSVKPWPAPSQWIQNWHHSWSPSPNILNNFLSPSPHPLLNTFLNGEAQRKYTPTPLPPILNTHDPPPPPPHLNSIYFFYDPHSSSSECPGPEFWIVFHRSLPAYLNGSKICIPRTRPIPMNSELAIFLNCPLQPRF